MDLKKKTKKILYKSYCPIIVDCHSQAKRYIKLKDSYCNLNIQPRKKAGI